METDTLTGDLITKYTIYTPPEVVGGYRLGKRDLGYVQFNLTYKPNWFHRQMMKLCLGWYWYDAK